MQSIAQSTVMTAALNEATSRLKALESTHTNTTTAIKDISSCIIKHSESITQQINDLKSLGKAFENQHTFIWALQTTQVQQNTQIKNMSQTQTEILRKLNVLLEKSQDGKPPAEDRMAAGGQDEWAQK